MTISKLPQSGFAIMDAYRETLHQHFHAAIQVSSHMSRLSLKSKLKKKVVKLSATENDWSWTTQETDYSDGKASAKLINDWVEKITQDKIKDLIKPDMLNALTRLVLVNAIYFKGDWKSKFDAKKTADEVGF